MTPKTKLEEIIHSISRTVQKSETAAARQKRTWSISKTKTKGNGWDSHDYQGDKFGIKSHRHERKRSFKLKYFLADKTKNF